MAPNNCDSDRQPEVVMWPCKPEVFISLEHQNFNCDTFNKVLPNDRDNDQVLCGITVFFSVTHCHCICIYAIKANAKMTFLLVCHSNVKCAKEKEKCEYYCYSVSMYGCILSPDVYSFARVKYIQSGQPYRYFRLLVIVRIIWGTFLNLSRLKTSDLPLEF